MPTQFSKFIIDATCKEYVHPWTDSCISATAGLGLHALQESFRIYTTVYLVTLLMRGKRPTKDEIIKTALGILQSTAFLSWSSFMFSFFLCTLRKCFGNFNVLSTAFLPSFLSSLSAIIIERPSRRLMLCLYVSNIATETLFRMGLWRGFYKSIPYGNVYIFASSMAALLYLYRSSAVKRDSIFRIIKFIASPYEDPIFVHNKFENKREKRNQENFKIQGKNIKFNIFIESMRTYQRFINWIKNCGKHSTCPHPDSCVHFVVGGGVKLFGIGLSVQLGLKLALQFKRLLKKPYLIKSIIFDKQNVNLAGFLGGFTAIYRLVSCSLRRIRGFDDKLHAIPAGLLAGLTFTMFPNNTVALYVMWKALQLLWNKGVDSGKLPEIKWFLIFLYCFSTAVLFHAAMLEPQNLRASYWKFLYNLSGGRLASMDRIPLDDFGLESSRNLQEVLLKTKTSNKLVYSF